MLREQKRKLEQQRSEIEADNDSHDSNDASNRDSVTMATTGSTQGKATAAGGSDGGGSGGGRSRVGSIGGRSDLSNSKHHQPPITPQKLILPKTMTKISPGSTSCPGTPQGSTVKGSGVAAATVTASPAASSGGAQQILVFAPTAHSTQLKLPAITHTVSAQSKGRFPATAADNRCHTDHAASQYYTADEGTRRCTAAPGGCYSSVTVVAVVIVVKLWK